MSSPLPTTKAQDTAALQEHFNTLFEVEKLSTTISKVKSKKIVLDARRQKNREALRALADLRKTDDIDNDFMLVDMSGTMVKLTLDVAEKYLSQQQTHIESQLLIATKELKQLVADLQLVAPSKGVDPKELELILRD